MGDEQETLKADCLLQIRRQSAFCFCSEIGVPNLAKVHSKTLARLAVQKGGEANDLSTSVYEKVSPLIRHRPAGADAAGRRGRVAHLWAEGGRQRALLGGQL